jgi:N-acetylmuramoyl-L-alanine amidase
MAASSLLSRRLLLSRLGTGGAVLGVMTWMVPDTAQAAELLAAPRSAPGPKSPPPAKAPVVMLDPGHGGRDPGAIGVSGTHEKRITLAAGLELKRLLEASRQYRVEMTRTRDVFIPLEERVARARARGAALFVSLHADALPDHSVRGASVYTLGATASDAQTAALARRENSADRHLGAAWRDTPPEVARILGSLVRRETRAGSTRIARNLVGSLDRDLPMLPNPSRHAGFAVLTAADIPSVLVEMGFMSNAKDEAALRKPEHRLVVVTAMKRAIDTYFAAANRTQETQSSTARTG